MTWIVVTALCYLVGMGSVSQIRTVNRLRRLLSRLPRSAVLACDGNTVTAVYYDATADEERSAILWLFSRPSCMLWPRRRRLSPTQASRRVSYELTWRTLVIVIVTIPLAVVGVWLADTRSWQWIYLVVLVVAYQVFVAVAGRTLIFKWGAVSGLAALIFLHRTGLWSAATVISLSFGYVLLTMIMLAYFARTDPDDPINRLRRESVKVADGERA
jgi:hypothetical protein